MAIRSRLLQGTLRVAPGVMLMAVAAAGGAWAFTHHAPRNSALDGGALVQLERPTPGSVIDTSWMDHMDTYMDERLFARTRMLEAHASVVSGVLRSPVLNNVYLHGPGGQLLERPPALKIRDTLEDEAAGLQKTLGDVPILWAYAPRKEEVYAAQIPQAWPNKYPQAKEAILQAWEGHGDVLDLTALVSAHAADGDAFFRTDHHWTPEVAREAADAAVADLAQAGVTLGADSRPYEQQSAPLPFFGSTGRIVTAGATDPDAFGYPVPEGGFKATMCIDDECGLPTVDQERLSNPNKYANRYAAFIGGDNGLVTITNDSPDAHGRVLLLKDSYGNAFATYLAERVSELVVVDERHYDGATLDVLADELKPDAVIVLHNPLSLLSSDFDASVWTRRGNVEIVEPKVVGDVAIVNEQGLLLQIGPEQTVDAGLADDAAAFVAAIDATDTPQLWFIAPRKEVVFADLMPPEVSNPVVANSAAVLAALRQATPVTDLTAELSDPARRYDYFLRTDHHWTTAGADVAVDAIVSGLADAGVEIGADDRPWTPQYGPLPFYGSEAIALPGDVDVIPDDLAYEAPVGGFRATLCFKPDECGLSPINEDWLTDPDRETNRYRAFLGGTTGLMHLHNDDPDAKGTIVMFSDSYGMPVGVRLGERVKDLYFIDERKWTGGPVGRFITDVDADAVVVLHNPVTVLANVFNRDVWRDAGD